MNKSPLPSPPSQNLKTNLPMLYYGLVVVGIAAVIFAIYNLLVIRWCTNRHSGLRQSRFRNSDAGRLSADLVSSTFKYKKEQNEQQNQECAVCLSIFEEGEEVRLLPRCLHSFHAQCIDMWLYSHPDCPLCRAPVGNATVASPLRRREDVPMMSMQSGRQQRVGSGENSSMEYSREGGNPRMQGSCCIEDRVYWKQQD